MKLVSSSCVAALIIASAQAARKLKIRQSAGSCHKYKCAPGWMPKADHHSLHGNSNTECCEKTCELWTCGAGYVANKAYFGNIGSSDQYCCDKQCGQGFQCDAQYAVNPTAPGTTHSECCLPRCSLFSCPDTWANSSTLSNVVSSKKEDCCLATCELFNCTAAGKLQDETKLNVTGDTTPECCTQYCSDIACPSGSAVPDELADNIFNTSADTCCRKQCKAHTCGTTWAPVVNKSEDFGDSDEVCCTPRCSQFNCSLEDGYVSSSLLASVVGGDSETCCLPTCKLWQCDNNMGWYTPLDNEKENQTGHTNAECCVRPCTYTVCPSGQAHITDANTTVLRDTSRCCEDARCDFYRTNLTQMGGGEYCNGLPADESCNTMYQNRTLNSSGTNVSFFVRCEVDTTYGICRYATEQNVSDCRSS